MRKKDKNIVTYGDLIRRHEKAIRELQADHDMLKKKKPFHRSVREAKEHIAHMKWRIESWRKEAAMVRKEREAKEARTRDNMNRFAMSEKILADTLAETPDND